MFKKLLKRLDKAPVPLGNEPTWTEGLLASLRDEVGRHPAPLEDESTAQAVARIFAERVEGVPAESTRQGRTDYGQAILALLLDNDTAPPAAQLRSEELQHARILLQGFFYGGENIQERADGLLSFIEECFACARYTQAAHLLELFDTEAETRRHNELNLFYESFLLRVRDTRARRDVKAPPEKEWHAVHAAAAAREGGLAEMVEWLARHAGIRLHSLFVDAQMRRAWREVLPNDANSSDLDELIAHLVPPKWRLADHSADALAARIADAATDSTLQQHALHLTKAAYFLTRVAGRTGLEYIIGRYTRWLDDTYECTGTRVLPSLHVGVIDQEHSLSRLLQQVAGEYLAARLVPAPRLDGPCLRNALEVVANSLNELELERVPPGDYNLNGLVYDHLLGFRFDDIHDALRIHRLL